MTAKELIEQTVGSQFQKHAHVRAIIPNHDSWWHVHRDEELPDDKALQVIIRVRRER